jgi:hypothetical protein
VPRPRKTRVTDQEIYWLPIWKPPTVSAFVSRSRGRGCISVIVESLFVKTSRFRVSFLFIDESVVRNCSSVSVQNIPTGYAIFHLFTLDATCFGINDYR